MVQAGWVLNAFHSNWSGTAIRPIVDTLCSASLASNQREISSNILKPLRCVGGVKTPRFRRPRFARPKGGLGAVVVLQTTNFRPTFNSKSP